MVLSFFLHEAHVFYLSSPAKNEHSGYKKAVFLALIFWTLLDIFCNYSNVVDGRDKVSQKWSFKTEPPG